MFAAKDHLTRVYFYDKVKNFSAKLQRVVFLTAVGKVQCVNYWVNSSSIWLKMVFKSVDSKPSANASVPHR